MEKLIEHGGIYMDIDVLSLKPFGDLLNNNCVVGVTAGLKRPDWPRPLLFPCAETGETNRVANRATTTIRAVNFMVPPCRG